MKYKRIIIEGRVHGIGFREFIRRKAISYGLVGYVKNVGDDKIEIIAADDEKKIEMLVKDCKKGPLLAHVKSVSVEDVELDEKFDGFYIKYI